MATEFQIYQVSWRAVMGGGLMKGTLLIFALNANEASQLAEAEVQRVIVGVTSIRIDDAQLLTPEE